MATSPLIPILAPDPTPAPSNVAPDSPILTPDPPRLTPDPPRLTLAPPNSTAATTPALEIPSIAPTSSASSTEHVAVSTPHSISASIPQQSPSPTVSENIQIENIQCEKIQSVNIQSEVVASECVSIQTISSATESSPTELPCINSSHTDCTPLNTLDPILDSSPDAICAQSNPLVSSPSTLQRMLSTENVTETTSTESVAESNSRPTNSRPTNISSSESETSSVEVASELSHTPPSAVTCGTDATDIVTTPAPTVPTPASADATPAPLTSAQFETTPASPVPVSPESVQRSRVSLGGSLFSLMNNLDFSCTDSPASSSSRPPTHPRDTPPTPTSSGRPSPLNPLAAEQCRLNKMPSPPVIAHSTFPQQPHQQPSPGHQQPPAGHQPPPPVPPQPLQAPGASLHTPHGRQLFAAARESCIRKLRRLSGIFPTWASQGGNLAWHIGAVQHCDSWPELLQYIQILQELGNVKTDPATAGTQAQNLLQQLGAIRNPASRHDATWMPLRPPVPASLAPDLNEPAVKKEKGADDLLMNLMELMKSAKEGRHPEQGGAYIPQSVGDKQLMYEPLSVPSDASKCVKQENGIETPGQLTSQMAAAIILLARAIKVPVAEVRMLLDSSCRVACQQARKSPIRKLSPAKPPLAPLYTSANTRAMKGVSFDRSKRNWEASWLDARTGRRVKKCFSEGRWGSSARDMAILARREAEDSGVISTRQQPNQQPPHHQYQTIQGLSSQGLPSQGLSSQGLSSSSPSGSTSPGTGTNTPCNGAASDSEESPKQDTDSSSSSSGLSSGLDGSTLAGMSGMSNMSNSNISNGMSNGNLSNLSNFGTRTFPLKSDYRQSTHSQSQLPFSADSLRQLIQSVHHRNSQNVDHTIRPNSNSSFLQAISADPNKVQQLLRLIEATEIGDGKRARPGSLENSNDVKRRKADGFDGTSSCQSSEGSATQAPQENRSDDNRPALQVLSLVKDFLISQEGKGHGASVHGEMLRHPP